MLNEKKETLEGAMDGSLNEFIYLYDFGDSWRHLIKPKLISKPNAEWFYPLCIAGERAAPTPLLARIRTVGVSSP